MTFIIRQSPKGIDLNFSKKFRAELDYETHWSSFICCNRASATGFLWLRALAENWIALLFLSCFHGE